MPAKKKKYSLKNDTRLHKQVEQDIRLLVKKLLREGTLSIVEIADIVEKTPDYVQALKQEIEQDNS